MQTFSYLRTLQIGGSDQWGNIVAGCEFIHKIDGKRAHGIIQVIYLTFFLQVVLLQRHKNAPIRIWSFLAIAK